MGVCLPYALFETFHNMMLQKTFVSLCSSETKDFIHTVVSENHRLPQVGM